MNRDELIEIMARSDAEFDGQSLTAMGRMARERYLVRSARAFAALENAIPGLPDLLAGKAVIVPREVTDDMADAGNDTMASGGFGGSADEVYAAMIAANPYGGWVVDYGHIVAHRDDKGRHVGWKFGCFQLGVSFDALTRLRRDAGRRINHWSDVQKQAGSSRDRDMARFASDEAKRAKQEARILADMAAYFFPSENGHLPRKVWALDDGPMLHLIRALTDPLDTYRSETDGQ